MQGAEVERGPPIPLCHAEAKWEVRAEQKGAAALSSLLSTHGANHCVNEFSFSTSHIQSLLPSFPLSTYLTAV